MNIIPFNNDQIIHYPEFTNLSLEILTKSEINCDIQVTPSWFAEEGVADYVWTGFKEMIWRIWKYVSTFLDHMLNGITIKRWRLIEIRQSLFQKALDDSAFNSTSILGYHYLDFSKLAEYLIQIYDMVNRIRDRIKQKNYDLTEDERNWIAVFLKASNQVDKQTVLLRPCAAQISTLSPVYCPIKNLDFDIPKTLAMVDKLITILENSANLEYFTIHSQSNISMLIHAMLDDEASVNLTEDLKLLNLSLTQSIKAYSCVTLQLCNQLLDICKVLKVKNLQ